MAKTKQKKVNPYAKQPVKKTNWALIAIIAVLVIALAVAGVLLLNGKNKDTAEEADSSLLSGTYYVQIDVKDYGTITAELYADIAPITVTNFVKLVNQGFYDGLTFHRIISGFMIQGGDPLGNGTGGSDEKIKGEFSANGVENTLTHTRGVLSMARSSAYNSASSQFFIMHADATYLDGQYAAFGKVISGMEVVDAICEKTPVTDSNGTVEKENQPVITSIRMIDKPQ
jgi:peptidyl-prolyl cis-trans isomerase B (cyclophilin B)